MKEPEMKVLAGWIAKAVKILKDRDAQEQMRLEIAEFCKAFPPPGIRIGG